MGIIPAALPHQILRRNQVEGRVGLSRSTIYKRISEQTFPKPVPLGIRAVGWLEADINGWIANQIEQSRRGGIK